MNMWLMIVLFVGLLVISFGAYWFYKKVKAEEVDEEDENFDEEDEESDEDEVSYEDEDEDLPFMERIVKPLIETHYNNFISTVNKFTPTGLDKRYKTLLRQAGLPRAYAPSKILIKQATLGLVALVGSIFLLIIMPKPPNPVVVIGAILVGTYLPLYGLRKKVAIRREEIERTLPELIDIVYISVEAGLSFDMAMRTASTRFDNSLAREIAQTMEEISRGKNRERAYRGIGERTQLEDVQLFISTVIQSERLGSNLANVLKIQVEILRDKRHQKAEEVISKMPVKMLLPLVFFLFPALFIVIIGPAVINIIRNYGGGLL